ncbi:MAG: thioether cross-link-forming SCIFF peptide maturase [Bacillota bacterium]|nr:thioether cross-link-forming SCIFF peptide maturase [Bacillota bacterium]
MIHFFEILNKKYIIDVNSGIVHEVDVLVYDIIKEDAYKKREKLNTIYDKYSKQLVDECIVELSNLEEKNLLYTEDKSITPKIEPTLKSMCLNIAHDCNLLCEYCFASKGDFGGNKELMSFQTGKKALDYLVENSHGRKNLEVDFFGGEPLMNFQVVKDLVEYGRKIEKENSKNFRFTITTNGMLLDEENMDYINKNFQNVVLSLDGRKEINDKMRLDKANKGTYDKIVPKFKNLVEERKGKDYFIRGTFTRENLDFTEDVKIIRNLGFDIISMEPVVTDEKNEFSINKEHVENVKKEYEKLCKYYIDKKNEGQGFNFFHFEIDLEGGPCIYKKISGCGAGNEYIAVAPSGNIYPCHQFVGEEDFIIGNVKEGITDKEIPNAMYNSNITTKEKCKDCWAKYFCGGGCHANAYNFNNSFMEPYEVGCELEKKRIECAIRIKSEE